MNNTSELFRDSHTCQYDKVNKFRITHLVVIAIAALTTYFGNTLILVSMRRFSKQLKGTAYILLGNLAVADLLLAIGLTLELTGYIFTSLETNGYFCVVKIIIIAISTATSGKLLLFISLDRFCAIMFPLKHLARSRKTRNRRIKLALVWSLSVVTVCVPISVNLSSSKAMEDCKFGKVIPESISLYASVFILSQFVISVVLCLLVMWRLRTNAMSRQKYKNIMIKCGFLMKVYVFFVICRVPFVLTTILIATSDDKQKYICVREYTVIPVLMNSAMNWILYGLANRKLRHAFKNVLLCRTEREIRAANYIQATRMDTATSRFGQEKEVVQSNSASETFD